jgi:hypothetical protein
VSWDWVLNWLLYLGVLALAAAMVGLAGPRHGAKRAVDGGPDGPYEPDLEQYAATLHELNATRTRARDDADWAALRGQCVPPWVDPDAVCLRCQVRQAPPGSAECDVCWGLPWEPDHSNERIQRLLDEFQEGLDTWLVRLDREDAERRLTVATAYPLALAAWRQPLAIDAAEPTGLHKAPLAIEAGSG